MTVDVRTTRHLRAQNCRHILEAIHAEGQLSAARLAEHCRLRPSTVSNIVKQLREAGAIRECGYGSSTQHGGKRPLLLQLASDYGAMVGFELTPYHFRAVARDFSLGLLHRFAVRLPDTYEAACAAIDAELISLSEAVGTLPPAGIVVGFNPRPVSARTNGAGTPQSLLSHLESGVAKRFDTSLEVEDHAGLGACGEWMLGGNRDARDVVFVDVGPEQLEEPGKIDVGLVLDGRLYRGKGRAGQLDARGTQDVGEVLGRIAELLDPGVIAIRSDHTPVPDSAEGRPVTTARFGEYAIAEGGCALAFDHTLDAIR